MNILPKKSVCFFGTGSTGDQYHRMVRVGRALEHYGWNIYGYGFDPDCKTPFQWQNELNDIGLAANMEWMVRQSYFTVVQMLQHPHAVEFLRAMQDTTKIPILAEMDDDCFNVDAWNPAVPRVDPAAGYVQCAEAQLKMVDGAVVSTERLKEVVLEQSERDMPVWVCPNTVNELWKGLVNHRPYDNKIRIGWEGASAHVGNLRLLKYVLPKILDAHPNVEVFLWGPLIPDWCQKHPRILVDLPQVTITDYPKALASRGYDIAICPLQDTLFNRAKSNIRWLEHSALKTPCVVSRVRAYDCVRDGEDGLVAQDEDEWYTALNKLILDRSFRKRIGGTAKERAWKDFHVGKACHVYEQIYQHFLPLNQTLIKEAESAARKAQEDAQLLASVIPDPTVEREVVHAGQ